MIFNKDSAKLLEDLTPNSVDAIITDPPYGMGIMGNEWDRILPPIDTWKAGLEVVKPGGFALVFGHTRYYHRLGVQLEEAGFEIRDCLCWAYATGFPRSYDPSKHINNTEEAKKWIGWGTVLKPAWEPILVARKPPEGTMVENLLKYQTGVLNIDECRIPYESEEDRKSLESFMKFEGQDLGDSRYFSMNQGGKKQVNVHPDGRWPANVLWLDPMYAHYDRFFLVPKPDKTEKRRYNLHDTVKPIELMERLISLVTSKPSVIGRDVVVLDPFMGSGTTGVACQKLNRSFIGYEIDTEQFETAGKRLSEKIMTDIFE